MADNWADEQLCPRRPPGGGNVRNPNANAKTRPSAKPSLAGQFVICPETCIRNANPDKLFAGQVSGQDIHRNVR